MAEELETKNDESKMYELGGRTEQMTMSQYAPALSVIEQSSSFYIVKDVDGKYHAVDKDDADVLTIAATGLIR